MSALQSLRKGKITAEPHFIGSIALQALLSPPPAGAEVPDRGCRRVGRVGAAVALLPVRPARLVLGQIDAVGTAPFVGRAVESCGTLRVFDRRKVDKAVVVRAGHLCRRGVRSNKFADGRAKGGC